MPEENTAIVGAEPTNTDTAKAGSEPVQDAKSESSTDKPAPFDSDPRWKSARLAEKKLQEILKANDLDDPDDLIDLVQSGKTVKGKLQDPNQIDDLISKAQKLEQYEAYWKDQEERKKREMEDPEQTIARLEQKLKAKTIEDQRKQNQQAQAENAKRAIQSYEREVVNLIKDMDIPKEHQPFINEFFGVGNPANEIDITDRKAIRKLVADGIKKKEAYDQEVIKAYLKGKGEIPKVSSSSSAPANENKPKIMLKDARKMFTEQMQKLTGG